jgi:hypothetical protein
MTKDLRRFCVTAVLHGTEDSKLPKNALEILVGRLEKLGILNWTDLRRFRDAPAQKAELKNTLEHWMYYALYKSEKVWTAHMA